MPVVDAPTLPDEPIVTDARRFSPIVTGLAVLVLLASLAPFLWLLYFTPRLSDVTMAERALPRIVSRTMDLRVALGQAPTWERRLYELMAGDAGRDLDQAIAWYEELARESPDSVTEAQLIVLLGEAGRLDDLRPRIEASTLPAAIRDAIEVAYLEGDPTATDGFEGADVKPYLPGWFFDRVAARWAARTGDAELAAVARRDQAVRARSLLARIRSLAALHTLTLVAGLAGLGRAIARRRRSPDALRCGAAPIPPPWSGRAGGVVLLRGAAIGAPLMLVLGIGYTTLEARYPVVHLFGWPVYVLMFLPVLLLARRHLLRPEGLELSEAFGLRLVGGRRRALVLAALATLGAGALADLAVGLGTDALGLSSHWTEWFEADLVWGSPASVAVTLVEFLFLAPVLEEMVFRGLLYPTLRRRLGFAPAALVSAAVFAVGHGYGVAGFASVFASGVIYAGAYEQTRSLLPSMFAHATSNLLAALAVILLLRA